MLRSVRYVTSPAGGTSSTLAGATSTAARSTGDGTTSQVVEEHLTGLLEGTTHYFRAAGSNIADRTNGAIRSFTSSGTPLSLLCNW
jgi:erythromycin esterase-like protein